MSIYYLQKVGQSVRRYKDKQTQQGERFDRKTKNWTNECAVQRSCEITHDSIITEAEASRVILE